MYHQKKETKISRIVADQPTTTTSCCPKSHDTTAIISTIASRRIRPDPLLSQTANMALAQSFAISAADASRPGSQSESEPIQLPPPQTFDILPPLHEILARVDHAPTDPMQAATGDADVVSYADLQPLEPRDLPHEVLGIKNKIRKALRELEKLPDMDRDVEQQEAEIKMLEEKAVKQREVLRKLGDVAKSKMR